MSSRAARSSTQCTRESSDATQTSLVGLRPHRKRTCRDAPLVRLLFCSRIYSPSRLAVKTRVMSLRKEENDFFSRRSVGIPSFYAILVLSVVSVHHTSRALGKNVAKASSPLLAAAAAAAAAGAVCFAYFDARARARS